MPSLDASFDRMVSALAERYGQPAPTPIGIADDTFAAILTAALSRTVDSRKVGKAIEALRESNLMEPAALAGADPIEVAETVRQAGAAMPAPVVGVLLRLAGWIVGSHGGSVASLDDVATALLRDQIRTLKGVGPASTDAILLEALGRPTYPVDRASYRILVRHGWLEPTADYDEARAILDAQAPDDAATLMRLSGWFERVGREACRPSVAKCERCPLQPFLPEGGPIEPDGI